jgi:hypothetical protein
VSACFTRSAGWSPRQDFNLHARRHSFLRRGCLAIPPRGGAKRGDRTRHLLLVTQPAHHLPCFAFVHRQGVEPCCADLSGPATYPRHGAWSAARVSNPSARLIRPGSSLEVGGWYGASESNRAAMLCKSMPSTSRGAPHGPGPWIRTTITSVKSSRPPVRRSQVSPDGGSCALAQRLMRARPSLDVVGNGSERRTRNGRFPFGCAALVLSRRVELRRATFGASPPGPLARAWRLWKESSLLGAVRSRATYP